MAASGFWILKAGFFVFLVQDLVFANAVKALLLAGTWRVVAFIFAFCDALGFLFKLALWC